MEQLIDLTRVLFALFVAYGRTTGIDYLKMPVGANAINMKSAEDGIRKVDPADFSAGFLNLLTQACWFKNLDGSLCLDFAVTFL
jgi:hypothetical protein